MLQEQAMIANLNIRSWTARKHDRSISEEVDATHNAQDGGRYNKMLINKTALDPITKHGGRVRDYHYTMTLPWGDNGDRLLPAKAYMDYTAAMRKFKGEGEALTRTFVNAYPNLVAEARNRLGTMYDAGDYPPASHIQDRFGLVVGFMPVPDAQDFRVDVGNEAMEEIRANINAVVCDRQAGAVKECWTRLSDVVGKLHNMMIKDKPIFRDSLIDNIGDLITMLPKLNIMEDPVMNKLCERIGMELMTPAYVLRKDPIAREIMASRAADILQIIATKL